MSMEHETDELAKLENKPEVELPEGGVLEAPSKEFVPGPYYMSADEVVSGLEEDPSGEDKSQASSTAVDRRDVLRLFSAGAMMSAVACVRRPSETAIPYVKQPIDQVPGVPTLYATTCGDCASGCGIVVKTREGFPVKLEGSGDHPISQGGLCAMGQASIQGLYHPERLKGAHVRHGKRLDPMNWDSVYRQLADAIKDKKRVGILTGGSTGHRNEFLREVLKKFGSDENRLYTFEPNSLFASVTKAHELAFGHGDMPRHELRKARIIVGIGSDLHDGGTSPIYHSKGFTQGQSFSNGNKGTFIQFESHLTLTGTAADTRHVITPGSETNVALLLVRSLYQNQASKGSASARRNIKALLDEHDARISAAYKEAGVTREVMDEVAAELLKYPSVVMAGGSGNFDENATLLQLAAIMANTLTGAYGTTLLYEKGWMPAPVKPGDLGRFLKDAPDLDVLFVIESNPVFSTPDSWGMAEVLGKIPVLVSLQSFPNEVDDIAKFVLPNHHYLEAWGDEQPVAGFWSARQPTVRPAAHSRQAEDSLLWILAYLERGLPYKDYRSWLMKKWQKVYNLFGTKVDFDTFFKAVLRRGFIGTLSSRTVGELNDLRTYFKEQAPAASGMVLTSPLDHRIHDGRGAHLPVLQETGDGLTTITWDSWVAVSPLTMKKMGLKQNQVVRIEGGFKSFEAALYPLPGLHPDAIVVPRGNGHTDEMSTISKDIGVDPLVAYPKKADPLTGQPVTGNLAVKLVATDRWHRLAAIQKHHDIANRTDIVKKISIQDARKQLKKKVDLDTVPDLYPALEQTKHKWGMSIDLGKCNGCGACTVACSLENNVPQVGRDQVILGREMHWIRMDRYFYGDVDNPVVTFQPVMCQHCNHAPCEAVCPVFATTHDPEGLNAMTYNRCVGTRYCANACPYKVRRFNWWTHKWGEMGKRPMDRNPRALNPDVTVRTRGVMEKCSFCVGRLRDAKHKAKELGREVYDGEVQTACQQTCPSDAITFGNLNDPQSKISKERKDFRAYLMLGGDPEHGHYGIKTLPSVNYLAAVTHDEPATGFGPDAKGHHKKDAGH